MKEYYIKFISKTLKDAIELAEKLWYSMIYGYTNPLSFVRDWILVLDKQWFYFTTCRDEKTLIKDWFKGLKLYKKLEPWTKVEVISYCNWIKWNIYTIHDCIENCFDEDMWYLYSMKETHYTFYSENIKPIQSLKRWDYVRIRKCKTVYIIMDISSWDKVKIKDISSWNIYNTELSKLELDSYLNESKLSLTAEWSIFKLWDLIKAWNEVYKVTSNTNVAFNIYTWIKIEINNKSNFKLYEDKELTEMVNSYYDNDWNEKQRNIIIDEPIDKKCADDLYAKAVNRMTNVFNKYHWNSTYLDFNDRNINTTSLNPDVLTDGQTNILINNNNTMEKLNQLRADKFFASEKNLTAIESLDTLLKDVIDLVVATKWELDRVQSKLIWLNRKLESATNNQDVALLKDLIASTKVIQEFVDELRWKTISKFENAKTKFDVAWYLKD